MPSHAHVSADPTGPPAAPHAGPGARPGSVGRSGSPVRRAVWAAVALLAAFLVGFGWQLLRAERLQATVDHTARALTAARLDVTLAAATIEAQQANYALARNDRASASVLRKLWGQYHTLAQRAGLDSATVPRAAR